MQVIDYYNCDRQEYWLEQIKKSDWGAGQFLYKLLSKNKFKDTVGEKSKVLMLVNDDGRYGWKAFQSLQEACKLGRVLNRLLVSYWQMAENGKITADKHYIWLEP